MSFVRIACVLAAALTAGTACGFDESADGQQVTHAVYRTKPTPETRLSLDLFYKSGPLDGGDGGTVRRAGASIALDYRAWFARVAWDPKVNFTPNDMVRVAVGVRF